MDAFKKALLWLADKAGMGEPKEGDSIKAEIDGKTYKVKILEKL